MRVALLAVERCGPSSGVVGHDTIAYGSSEVIPARSSMIMVMRVSGSWNPWAVDEDPGDGRAV